MSSSPWASRAATAASARSRATPPPTTIPSSIAARVAASASSTRDLRSLSSTSVAAPTRITATPPLRRATRSSSFSLSHCEVDSSAWARISATRAWIDVESPAPSMTVVVSLVTAARRARPSMSTVVFSSLKPRSSVTTVPPVRTARSSSIALRRSPNPGAFTATVVIVPRSLLTIRVASASPSTSSAMMSSGRRVCTTRSSTGSSSATVFTLRSVMRMKGSSSCASIACWSVTKCGET